VIAARLVGEVSRQYKDDIRYNGTGSFDYKLQIFQDVCNRVNFPRESLMKAFPIMLTGLAQETYYNQNLHLFAYEDAIARIRSYFESPVTQHAVLVEWNGVTLRSITLKNPGKSMIESL
jgi:hypothetical protein